VIPRLTTDLVALLQDPARREKARHLLIASDFSPEKWSQMDK
jgi:hypothetical protein